MKRRGFTLIDACVIVAVIGILAVILYPVVRPRPLMWSRTPLPSIRFKNAELRTVVFILHQEMYQKRKMGFLQETRWEPPNLKHRRVTFQTQDGMTLRQMLTTIEKQADVVFEGGGSCGNCGWPMGPLKVREASKAAVN